MKIWAVVVAQLVDRSLPIQEVRGSNPVISKKLFILNICLLSTVYWKDENKEKEAGNSQKMLKICFRIVTILNGTKRNEIKFCVKRSFGPLSNSFKTFSTFDLNSTSGRKEGKWRFPEKKRLKFRKLFLISIHISLYKVIGRIDQLVISVNRLGDSWKFLATNFLIKVAKIISNLLDYFEECNFLRKNWF